MEKEIWKDIEGYEDCYSISNFGRVKSKDRIVKHGEDSFLTLKSQLIKQGVHTEGYPSVVLSKNKKSSTKYVHRLLAQTFIPNPENKRCVNHKDGNKKYNRLFNLEWVTHQENSDHAITNGLYNPKLNDGGKKKIIQYSLGGHFIKEWQSLTNASKSLNIRISNICQVARGHHHAAGGYKWGYCS